MQTVHRWLRVGLAALVPGLALGLGCVGPALAINPTAPKGGCSCGCGCGGDNLSGGVSRAGSQTSQNYVRYVDGQVTMVNDDLRVSPTPAPLWGHSRMFGNTAGNNDSRNNGNRWFVHQWPQATRDGPSCNPDATIVVVFDPTEAYWFDLSGGAYSPRYGAKQTLVHDTSAKVYRMTSTDDGSFYEFNDFVQTAKPQGYFSRRVTAAGQTVAATATSASPARITQMQLTVSGGTAAYEQYDYAYGSTSGSAGQLTSVILSRYDTALASLQQLRQASYTYYDGSGTCGASGDLQSALCQSKSGGSWVGSDTYYYRYYIDSSSGGFPHGLKYVFRPLGYSNLVAALGHAPTNSDSDSAVAPYACFAFQYNATTGAATQEAVFGQSQTYTFSYVNGSGGDPNQWQTKTVEQELTSGSAALYSNTVYTNPVGQVLLTDLEATSGTWYSYRNYDTAYRLLLEAEPSAVLSYSLSGGNWDSSTPTGGTAGLVHETNYYSSSSTLGTETVPGGAPGYAAYQLVRQAPPTLSPLFSDDTGPGFLPLSGGTPSGGTAAVEGYSLYYSHSGALAIVGTAAGVTGGTQTIFPTAAQTTYSDPSGGSASAIAYSFSYTWALTGGTASPVGLQPQQETTTLPIVPAAQNGPTTGSAAWTRLAYYNLNGDISWQMDERGRVNYAAFDPVTGNRTQTILDISSSAASGLSPPSGWTIPASALSLSSSYQCDPLGRSNQILGPAYSNDLGHSVQTASWSVYDDPDHIVYSAQGYFDLTASSTATVNPVSISMYDNGGHVLQSIQATSGGTAVSTSGSLLSLSSSALGSLSTTQSNFCRWSVDQYCKSRLAKTAAYFLIPSSGTAVGNGFVGSAGTLGTYGVSVGNYNVSQYGYETLGSSAGSAAWYGRPNKTQTPGGTIQRQVLDVRNNVLSSWIGTSDIDATDADPTGGSVGTGAGNNMVQVSGGTWDIDGNLTQSALYVSGTSARTTIFGYDWRDRRVSTTSNDGLNNSGNSYLTQNTLDNLGRAIQVQQFFTPSGGSATLIASNSASYDPLGHSYQQQTSAVNVTSGTVGSTLTSNTWFDAAGNAVKSLPAGAQTFSKTVFDGIGRAVTSYAGYNLAETGYPIPSGSISVTVTGDTIFAQTETTFDAASNAIFMASRGRLANSGTATGDLSAGGGTLARSSYTATWQDGIGRTLAAADYGINGGTAMTVASRSTVAPSTTASSSLMLVNATVYNPRGEAFQTIDPKGRVDQQTLDDEGRSIAAIQNVVSGGTAADQNVTVQTAYTIDGQVATLTASNATTGSQVTQYAYGTSAGTADSGVARSDLLKAVIYPDSTNTFTMSGGTTTGGFPISGTPTFSGTYNRVQYTYNQLGERATMQDQNSTVHSYSLDGLGRGTADSVALAMGSKVDSTVLQIARAYEPRGMLQHVTSFANSSGTGTAVNDVLMVYNDFGQLTTDYQAHAGAVVTSGAGVSPAVQYTYSSGTANTIRPIGVIYPSNSRTITFGYNAGVDDNLSRVSYLASSGGSLSSGTLSQFGYLGLGRIVTETYPIPGVALDYTGGTAATYAGLDNFDRIQQQSWLSTTAGTLDQFNYSYDLAGNRLTRQNLVGTSKDEQYTYDGVYRLYTSTQGSLSGGTISAPVHTEAWGLDATGNWNTYSSSGSWGALSQTRSHNTANQLLSIAGTGAATLNYDQAGNTTVLPATPTGGTLTLSGSCTYDAWNRLMSITGGTAAVLPSFAYDGPGRRIQKSIVGVGTTDYYLDDQQVVETQFTSGGSTALQYQYVWSPRYIDAAVLRDDFTSGRAYATVYYLNDANMNVTSLVAFSGPAWVAVERYVYSAYGEPRFYDGSWTWIPSSTARNAVLYTGRELDSETGLYYYRARYYSPVLGRFITRDPIDYAGGINLYEYSGSTPAAALDPSGLAHVTWKTTTGSAQHHWFPQKDRAKIEGLCAAVNFKIDAFTTGCNPILRSEFPVFSRCA